MLFDDSLEHLISPVLTMPSPVVFLGGSTENRQSSLYSLAYTVAMGVAKSGRGVITGGSTGVMEAASRGALEGNCELSGCISSMRDETFVNSYVTNGLCVICKDEIERLKCLSNYFDTFVVFPGGLGTLQEISTILYHESFEQNRKLNIYLISVQFWRPLKNWLIDHVLKGKFLQEETLSRVHVLDSIASLYEKLKEK